MVPDGSDMALDGSLMCLCTLQLVGVLTHAPAAAPCCRKFTVTDVDLIFQKVKARLLPANALQCAAATLS